MEIQFFAWAMVLSVVIFFVPKRFQYFSALLFQGVIIIATSIVAIDSLINGPLVTPPVLAYLLGKPVFAVVDELSAYFILVINFTMLSGLLYAGGYLKPYLEKRNKAEMGLHYFSFLWLHVSMLLVSMIRDGFAFLIAWELMTIFSFILVIFESDKKEIIKAGINYLIQMHVGLVFIMAAFFIAFTKTGAEFSFDGLASYFTSQKPFPLFLLFFTGFGIKAGFIPLHTWLPHAHPAAPSHVSAVMSGVMIKMGIYGILRVLTYIHTDLLYIGIFVLCVSLISGVIGVTMAIMQHDIKKLLAYHSIENIGIIGIGIGLGIIGLAMNQPVIAVLGFAGGILHILNHSLFKSLLFYSAGSVYQKTHTRNVDQLGGVMKKMPYTALLFLLGSLAICGLPPFNGFISEFLIYSGLFRGLLPGDLPMDVIILISFVGLVFIGGLAIFCFTKIFGVVFLGSPRSKSVGKATEVSGMMLFPQIMAGVLILFIGLAPGLFMNPLNRIVSIFTGTTSILPNAIPVMNNISLFSGIFIVLVGLLWLVRRRVQTSKVIETGASWGCGYTGADAAVHQYSATSWADSVGELASGVVKVKKQHRSFEEEEIFATPRSFETHTSDIFEETLVTKPASNLLKWFEKSAVFLTGNLQHYLLYALVFMIFIFLLTLLNVI
ncbi:MAG: NADH-quinone oxidoreductase subunit E [Clostridia bacterium]|nr:NADH-quinone oxidoreductase subunit E [Clostridia bacterium]